MNKNAADRISETDGFWDLEEMLPAKRTPRRFSSDTGTAEVSLGNDNEKEMSEPIPKRPVMTQRNLPSPCSPRLTVRRAKCPLSSRAALAA